MKAIKLILFFLGVFTYSFAQQNLVITDTVFYNIYGGPNQDQARDFIEMPDKGFLICGSSSSYGQGTSSVYLVKTDSVGRFKWGKTYGGINADWGMTIVNTPEGGAMISGYSNSFNNLDYDVYCFKIDAAGTVIWERAYVSDDWEFIYGSAALPDSGLVMVGETYTNTVGDADALLMRINKNGDTLWTKRYATANYEKLEAVICWNNKIYACGKVIDPATQMERAMVLKYDLAGNLVASNILGGSPIRNYYLKSINKASGYNLITSGGIVEPSAGTNDEVDLRARLDTSLNLIWKDSAGLVDKKRCDYIFEDVRGHLMAVYSTFGGNGKDALLLADFINQWYTYGQTYGGLEDEEGLTGMISSRNKLVFLGITNSWGFGDQDYWLIMFKADTLIPDHKVKYTYYNDTIALNPFDIKENSKEQFRVTPNPVSKNSFIKIDTKITDELVELELFDVTGRKVYGKKEEITEVLDLKYLQLKEGVYFLRLKSKEFQFSYKLLITD